MMTVKHFVRNLIANPFAFVVASWAVITFFRSIFDPGTTAASDVIPQVLFLLWSATYAVGGLLILWGHGILSPKIAATGCILFAQGAFLNAMAVMYNPINGYWVGIQAFMFGCAALVRMRHLMKGEMLTWVGHTIVVTEKQIRVEEANDSRAEVQAQ